MSTEATEAEMRAKGLVHRQITTKKGNRVWRWVRPDNENVVEPAIPADSIARAAKRKVAVPKPEPEPEPVVVVKPKRWAITGYLSCCGGRIIRAEPDATAAPVDTRTEDQMRADYERTQMCRQWKQYKDAEDAGRRALKRLNAGQNPNQSEVFYYYTVEAYGKEVSIAHVKRILRDYQAAMNSYSFETYKVKGDIYARNNAPITYSPTCPTGTGITVSVTEFPGSTQTPAGLWVRQDQKPPSTPVEVYPAVEQPKIVKGQGVAYSVTQDPYDKNHVLIYLGGNNIMSASLWNTISKHKATWAKPGTIVTFIRTDRQMSKATAEDMAQGGFHCALIAGNKTHPTSSVLYLYERKLTEADIEQL